MSNIDEVVARVQEYDIEADYSYTNVWAGCDPGWGRESHFAIVFIAWVDRIARVIYHESVKNPLHEDMVKQINKLIFYYKPCKFFIDAEAANLYKSLAYTHESHYIDYERLKGKELVDVLYNSRYGGCRSPLIVPIPFNKEHENMMRML